MQKKDWNKTTGMLFLTYFMIGVVVNVITVSFPVLYHELGMSAKEIGILTSIVYLGAICQPLIGYICDISGRKVRVLQGLFIILTMAILLMSVFKTFYAYIILVFLVSICRRPALAILDEISLTAQKQFDLNYGKVRSGTSWGFALGMFFLIPLSPFGMINAILGTGIIFSSLVIALTGYLDKLIPYTESKQKESKKNEIYKQEMKEKIFVPKYLSLIVAYFFIMGSLSLKTNYQNLLLGEIGTGVYLISIINFLAILPEMLLMPKTEKMLGDISYKKMITIVALLTALLQFLLAISSSGIFVAMIIWLHGVIYAIHLPIFYKYFKNYLGNNVSSTGFLLNLMFTSLAIVLLNTFIVTPIYTEYGIQDVYMFLAVMPLVGLLIAYTVKE